MPVYAEPVFGDARWCEIDDGIGPRQRLGHGLSNLDAGRHAFEVTDTIDDAGLALLEASQLLDQQLGALRKSLGRAGSERKARGYGHAGDIGKAQTIRHALFRHVAGNGDAVAVELGAPGVRRDPDRLDHDISLRNTWGEICQGHLHGAQSLFRPSPASGIERQPGQLEQTAVDLFGLRQRKIDASAPEGLVGLAGADLQIHFCQARYGSQLLAHCLIWHAPKETYGIAFNCYVNSVGRCERGNGDRLVDRGNAGQCCQAGDGLITFGLRSGGSGQRDPTARQCDMRPFLARRLKSGPALLSKGIQHRRTCHGQGGHRAAENCHNAWRHPLEEVPDHPESIGKPLLGQR